MGFWSNDPVQTTDSGIAIKNLPNDRPTFKRRYTARINDQVSMKVELETSSFGDRYDSSELDQSNGRLVLFDLKAPADKILDREILPIVQQRCDEILALDRAYLKSDPNEFIDEAGVKWRRAE